MSVFCKTQTRDRSGTRADLEGLGEGTASEGEKQPQKSRLHMQRAWARAENQSSAFARSYLHRSSLEVLSEATPC